jgi:hypothetical protein
MHISRFSMKNFRNFGDQAFVIEFRPLTLPFGNLKGGFELFHWVALRTSAIHSIDGVIILQSRQLGRAGNALYAIRRCARNR